MLQKRVIKYLFIAMLGIPFLISCIPQKRLVLFQKKDKKDTTFFPVTVPLYQLKTGDNITVAVTGLDEKTAGIFNTQTKNYGTYNVSSNVVTYNQNISLTPNMYLWSYTINDSGYINFPLINRIYLKGLTLREAQVRIQDSINQYANYITAIVKYVSFQINVMGEINKPGLIWVYGEYCNLLDVIGLAGDFTDYANKNEVKLIRKTDNGNQIVTLDITDQKIIGSEFYYLRPGDVIYVSPMAAKSFGLRQFQLSTYVNLAVSILLFVNALRLY